MGILDKLKFILRGSYPDKQSGDKAVIEELKKLGSNPSESHHINHYLYFPKKDDAQGAASILKGEGFSIELRMGADKINWLVFASHQLPPTEDSIEEVRARMETLAEQFHGEYDGWEAALPSMNRPN